jgi:hypothetical protein
LSVTCPFAVLQTIQPVRHPTSTQDVVQRRGVRNARLTLGEIGAR